MSMRKFQCLWPVLVLMALLFCSGTTEAAIVNGGFEQSFYGWLTTGNAIVMPALTLDDGAGGSVAFKPLEGSNMALIGGANGFVTDNKITQDITLGAQDKYLNVAYRFWTYDESPFDSPGFVIDINGSTVFSLKAGDVGDGTEGTLNYSNGNLTDHWANIGIPIAQYYSPNGRVSSIRISFNAGNTGDLQYPSGVFLDAVNLSSEAPVGTAPIPNSLLLLASGLLGVVGFKKCTS